MTSDRLTFLYGEDVELEAWELDDLELRSQLLQPTFTHELSTMEMISREIIANQILDDDPPEVWQTVQRLRDLDSDRNDIFRQLSLAFTPVLQHAVAVGDAWDRGEYVEALRALPLPTAAEIEATLIEIVRANQGISSVDLSDVALERLGRPAGDPVAQSMLDRVIDHLVDDLGPLAWTAGDHMVHVTDLTDGIVLTHALTADERSTGILDGSFDLAALLRTERLTLPTGDAVDVLMFVRSDLRLRGPEGWLRRFEAGSMLAVLVEPGGVLHIEPVAHAPSVDAGLAARLRAAYDETVAEPWLPVSGEELVLALQLEDRVTFRTPQAPLRALAASVGLELRGPEVAHDESVWHSAVRLERMDRVRDELDNDRPRVLKVLHALDVADLVFGVDAESIPDIDPPLDDGMLREVLIDLRDHEVLETCASELLDAPGTDTRPRAEAFIEALLRAARRPKEVAVARLIAALAAERARDPLVAEQHLKLAHEADPTDGFAIDRLAWYASDRGDALRAAQLWRQLDPSPAIEQDLRGVERFAAPTSAPVGRNDPCWCGSGRKFKQCHLGAPSLPALPDRAGWLCRKAVAYVERHGPDARDDVFGVALARAIDPDDRHSVAEAFEDPIVMDLVLTEGGWFERFVEERGALLPDDEALLAHSWTMVDRTVYEVLAVRPGEGVELADLRTGERVDVRERTFSREASIGELVCARACPDGESRQLIGGIIPVEPGREAALLDLLDDGDPEEIAAWVAARYRPPTLQTREGEDMVQCELRIDIGDAAAARQFLDSTYEPQGDEDTWVELFPLDDDEHIVRARLALDGADLRVSTTSEARADRVLAAILGALPQANVRRDERTPVDLQATVGRGGDIVGVEDVFGESRAGLAAPTPELAVALEELRDRFEERWCDESVPALGGLTPREAAADPTRREQLERLLASFERRASAGEVAMRPERLRELLGL